MTRSSTHLIKDSKEREDEPLLSQVPRDKYLLAYWVFVIQGCGILLPWNAFISAADYFSSLYGPSFVFFMSILFNIPSVICYLFFSKILPRFSFGNRVNFSLVLFFVVMLVIPFLPESEHSLSLGITLAGVFITGLGSAIMQGSVAGLATLFPPEYMGGVMSGSGWAGVATIGMRVVTKAVLPGTEAGLRRSGELFFMLAVGIVVLCFVSFQFLMRLPITKHNTAVYYKVKNADLHMAEAKHATFSEILPKIWTDAVVIITTFFVTLSLFPGVTGLVKSESKAFQSESGQAWFTILFTAIFMIGDVIGRTAPRWFLIFRPKVLIIPCLMRLAFFPLLVFCIRPHLIHHDWITCTIGAVFALSNGYISTLGMIYGPQKVSAHEKELTGIILSGCITGGIILGSNFAFLMLYLVTGSIGVKL